MSKERYSRQILFREIGEKGQQKLLKSTVAIIGCGALGAAHAEALCRAGVGRLRLIDRDFVEFSNLQRQSLYTESDAISRLPKAVAAASRLNKVNSEIEIEALVENVDQSNILDLIEGSDVVIDGTDNFSIRYLVNDACDKLSIPWVYGAAVSSYGSTMTIIPDETACLRCVFEEMPPAGSSPTCDTAGVIHPIIAMISALQVTETLKLLIGDRTSLHGSLIQFDAWSVDFRKIRGVKKREDCPCCGEKNYEFLSGTDDEFVTVLCGRDAVQIKPPNSQHIDFDVLKKNLSGVTELNSNEYLMRFNVDSYEFTVFRDSRAIIKGTSDLSEARSAYSRYIGN